MVVYQINEANISLYSEEESETQRGRQVKMIYDVLSESSQLGIIDLPFSLWSSLSLKNLKKEASQDGQPVPSKIQIGLGCRYINHLLIVFLSFILQLIFSMDLYGPSLFVIVIKDGELRLPRLISTSSC